MSHQQSITLEKLLSYLAVTTGKKQVSTDVLRAYKHALRDIPLRPLANAINAIIQKDDWFPSVARILREVALQAGLQAPPPDAAWAEVMAQVAAVGRHRRPKWSHKAIAEAVRGVGWQELCNSTNSDVLRAHFYRAYLVAEKRTEVNASLRVASGNIPQLHDGGKG